MPTRGLQTMMETLARGEPLPPTPLSNFLGLRLTTLEPGRAVAELLPDERHVAGRDVRSVFGGFVAALADYVMGMAYNASLDEGQTGPTLELKINFLRPARPGVLLRAEARLLKSGGSTGLATCDVTDAEGQLIAHATCTCMRILPRPASPT